MTESEQHTDDRVGHKNTDIQSVSANLDIITLNINTDTHQPALFQCYHMPLFQHPQIYSICKGLVTMQHTQQGVLYFSYHSHARTQTHMHHTCVRVHTQMHAHVHART